MKLRKREMSQFFFFQRGGGGLYFLKMATTISSKCSHTVLSCQIPSRLGLYLSTSLNLDGTSDYFWPTEYSINDAAPLLGLALNWPDSFCFLPLGNQTTCNKSTYPETTVLWEPSDMWKGVGVWDTKWREREAKEHWGVRRVVKKPSWKWILQP